MEEEVCSGPDRAGAAERSGVETMGLEPTTPALQRRFKRGADLRK